MKIGGAGMMGAGVMSDVLAGLAAPAQPQRRTMQDLTDVELLGFNRQFAQDRGRYERELGAIANEVRRRQAAGIWNPRGS